MTTVSETFPAGKYVISDLCYVLSDDTWTEIHELMFPPGHNGHEINGLFTLKDGRKLFIGCTKYGDGNYPDTVGNVYGVDSGTIGIMLESEIDGEADGDDSIVHIFDEPFTVLYDNGNFSFGHIDIDTGFYDDHEEDDWDEEDEPHPNAN
jgi:hypothetical protein